MDCREARRRLSEWVDEELDDVEDGLVRSHIERCLTCREEAKALRKLSALLRRSQDEDLSPDFRARLMAQLLQRERDRQPLWMLTGTRLGWIIGTSYGAPVADCSKAVLTYPEYRHGTHHPVVPPGEDRIRSLEIPLPWLHHRR